MTIAITLKVNDGVVLASDSAATLMESGTAQVIQVFNNAAKIFNLRKGLPIGLMVWGGGSIGRAAMSTLAKDLRRRFTVPDETHKDWHIDETAYSMAEVARRVRQFMYEEHYVPAVASWPHKPFIGFMVAGYSSGASLAEEYRIEIRNDGGCDAPVLNAPHDVCNLSWDGEPEAISRLLMGFSPRIGEVLLKMGVEEKHLPAALGVLRKELATPVIYDAMPIQDAIDLAEFLVDLTERFSRYTPGAATVGGPIEIAAITKHEGFKWVKRKHYFSEALNPETA